MNAAASQGVSFLYLELLMDGGYIDAQVAEVDAKNRGDLLDAEVESRER